MAALVALCAVLVPLPAAALAAIPHVAASNDTDSCAMCHRVKTAAANVNTEWSRVVASETGDAGDLANALLVGMDTALDDTGLCYSCHGVERLGSGVDVQSALEADSGHVTAPDASEYGRSPKQCSTCHDAHGTDKVDGAPRPGLLRSIVSTSEVLYSGAAYCASCHPDNRTSDRWDGLAVWERTAHASQLPTPASGTGIVCSVCHDPHGSDIAPSIEPTIMPPAVLPEAGLGVAANDRSFCLLCHQFSATPTSWVSSATYAPSAHGSSAATVAIPGEWPARDLTSAEASRAVGECQVCHAPMGRSDGAGGAIPKLAEKRGRQLCDDCHDADGPARSNIATLAFPASRVDTEVIAVWRPSVETSIYGDVAVYTRDLTESVPATLTGPRVFPPSRRTGDAAAGDINDDGVNELVMGDSSRAVVDVFRRDPVQGLVRRSLSVPDGVKPYLVEVANVVAHGSGPHGANDDSAEVIVVERDPEPPHASTLHVFAYNGSSLQPIFSQTIGADASDLAVGHITGTGLADIIVTSWGPDEVRVFTEDLGSDNPATVAEVAGGPFSTGAGSNPIGVSVGDVWAADAGNEFVVCLSGLTSDNVGVLGVLAGNIVLHQAPLSTTGAANANRPYDSAVADVLWDSATAEVVVALRSDPATDAISATSSIDVFEQIDAPGSGLETTPENHTTGLNYESSAVEAGDVDGDGRVEVVVGNSGKWLRGGNKMPPSLMVFDSTNGTTLGSPRTLWSTGVEQASGIYETTTTALGTAPSVVVADLGAVGPARHPGDAGSVSHVSTETAGLGRHVTCADCHNPHETTATVQTAPSAIYGALKGAWGALFTGSAPGTYSASQNSSPTAEYQVCLKCHSAFGELDRTRDVAAEAWTANASTHAMMGPSLTASAPASTFVTPTAGQFVNSTADGTTNWTKDSQLYCIDCHTNSDTAQAKGPHVSGEGSLLRAPYWGVLPEAGSQGFLCYLCHKRSIYFGGGSGSEFYHYGKPDMHKLHTADTGFSCRTCHVSHGSATLSHLQNADHGYEHNATGGACTTECHTGGARHPYSRSTTVITPSEFSVSNATTYTGELSSILTRDTVDLVVTEGNGVGSDYSIETTFTGVGALPAGIEYYGRYQGSPGHVVRVQAWNYSLVAADKWVDIGQWPSTAVRGTFSYALTTQGFLSGGTMRVRILHDSPGNPNHRHYIDSVWLNP